MIFNIEKLKIKIKIKIKIKLKIKIKIKIRIWLGEPLGGGRGNRLAVAGGTGLQHVFYRVFRHCIRTL